VDKYQVPELQTQVEVEVVVHHKLLLCQVLLVVLV
jgi:hypothetical protein